MRKPAIAIFVAVFGFYLLTSSREPAWGDAHPMWEVAAHLVDGFHVDIQTRWPEDIPTGRGGKIYGIAAIGDALAHVPGAAVMAVSHRIAPSQDALVRPLAVHLGPSALGALTAVLLFLLLVDLGVRARTASLCTAISAVATSTWVYAHYPYSEILQVAVVLGAFRATLRTCNEALPPLAARREALWLGAWLGMLVNAKYVLALVALGAVVTIAWTLRTRRVELRRVALWACASGAPFAVLAMVYNLVRWESPFATGYGPYLDAYFGGSVFDGAWGMLASPNKSALLYSPPLVLALVGLPAAIRKVPRLGLALVAMLVPTFLVCCTYRSWSGDYAWGPRFFVWLVPPLMVGLAFFIDNMGRAKRALVAGVVAAGIAVQLLGCALYWDHYIRIAIDAKNQWLGNPNRKGAYVAEKGRGHCDSCFEDTYEILWTPAFQPIRGHWWLLKSLARGDTAAEAQADAPWRTYTSLPLNLDQSYARARIDWWGLLWIKDATDTRVLGVILLLVFAGGTGLGIALWLRYHRSTA
jgi:hypothetical protein